MYKRQLVERLPLSSPALEIDWGEQGGQETGDAVELPKELVQDVESEPGSYQEARQSKHAMIWDGAMSADVEGLIRAGTFTLPVKIPVGCNVIDARWVFKWKADKTGKIVKAKARLVAKGFKQKTAYEIMPSLVGSEMCIRDSVNVPALIKPSTSADMAPSQIFACFDCRAS